MSEPFFHRASTHSFIDRLSDLDPVVLYVGAGASIERTGVDWSGLMAQLLDAALGDFQQRRAAVRTIQPQAAASAVAEQYRRSGDSWRGRLTDAIRAQLYRGDEGTLSYFNDRVLALANDLIGAGRRVSIVTPNYDSYLLDALGVMSDSDRKFTAAQRFVFGVDDVAVPEPPLHTRLENLRNALADQTVLPIVHLHGLVGRVAESGAPPYPVVSEEDYAATRGQSREILRTLIDERDVVIVGASVTDPPLVQALVETRGQRQRFAVQSLQGRPVKSDIEQRVLTIEDDRARHLGLELIRTNYFFQIPQTLEEVRTDLALEYRDRHYADADAEFRYGQRLASWWSDWLHNAGSKIAARQQETYEYLRNALDEVRRIIGAPPDEQLRLELWIRWAPNERQLALFAASTGSWPDTLTMRRDLISDESPYTATQAFVNGAPTYATAPTGMRWRSFLAVPVRIVDATRSYLPVEAMSLSSMREQGASSLDPRSYAAADALITYLGVVGRQVLGPTRA